MAIQTRQLGVATDATNGSVATLSVDYDDVALRLTAVHIANPTTLPVFCTARRAAGGGQTYTLNVPAGSSNDTTIPGNTAARLSVTIDAQGRIDGVDYTFGFGTA